MGTLNRGCYFKKSKRIIDGDIVAGVGVGILRLGISKKELIKIIGEKYNEQWIETFSIIKIQNAKIWVSHDDKVDQIGVGKNFKGKYKKIIGIESTLSEVKKYVGDYVVNYDTYEMKNDKGICFELKDIEEWEEQKAPIEFIYVFRTK